MVEQYTTFQGYGATDSLDLGRLDGCTINLLWTTSDNIGGAHGTTMTTAFAFDAETGERLSLSDVAINADALSMQLEEQVLQQMEQAPEQYFSEAQQWVPQLLEDGCWYFSEDGVVLLSNPGVLAPYSAGTLKFTATYEALTGLLDERWIPDPAADSQGEPQIALTADDGAPAPTETVQADTSGAEMVLWTDGVLEDFRIWRVTSSDGVTWYRGGLLLRRRPPGGGAGRGPDSHAARCHDQCDDFLYGGRGDRLPGHRGERQGRFGVFPGTGHGH